MGDNKQKRRVCEVSPNFNYLAKMWMYNDDTCVRGQLNGQLKVLTVSSDEELATQHPPYIHLPTALQLVTQDTRVTATRENREDMWCRHLAILLEQRSILGDEKLRRHVLDRGLDPRHLKCTDWARYTDDTMETGEMLVGALRRSFGLFARADDACECGLLARGQGG